MGPVTCQSEQKRIKTPRFPEKRGKQPCEKIHLVALLADDLPLLVGVVGAGDGIGAGGALLAVLLRMKTTFISYVMWEN